jgi:hypothetical protein
MPEENPNEPVETELQQHDNPAQEAGGAEEEPFDRKRAEAALRKKNSEAENLRKRLKELEPLAQRAKELEDAQKSEAERLTEQLSVQRETAQKAVRVAVEAKVEALAASTFADPSDAAGALDLASYADDAGVIDTEAIKADLADLLQRKPHWAKAPEGPRRPAPDRSQGSSGNGSRTPMKPEDEFASWLGNALGQTR